MQNNTFAVEANCVRPSPTGMECYNHIKKRNESYAFSIDKTNVGDGSFGKSDRAYTL
ncbi:MAG: hypothetical protein IKK26_03270 [Clostridia bacterium]|nr:hypothetical protein [Clostridia bacterium]